MEPEIPKGPLAVRWGEWKVEAPLAGTLGRARVALENAGSATWRPGRVKLSYHWLDERGNPIHWDGLRTELEHAVAPGERLEAELAIRGPIPPGRYRLAFDLVDEGRLWFAEVGSATLEREVDVLPRDGSAARSWLPEDAEPAADRQQRIDAAHAEGYAAVGGSLEGRRLPHELEPYAAGPGRVPNFPYPLVCPSLLPGLEPNEEVAGLPAWRPVGEEPWLYDGRIRARLPAGRRRG